MSARCARAPNAPLDGTYEITGSKIFITYGEHDLTDNIIHFVLARLPDAPTGTKGISLFLVPKFFVNDDGSIGARNDVRCHSIEHKLGIHGSPTCTMVYGDKGGATGWLVGEENRGLNCMFTMMNNARLAVGLQGVAIAERATQQAYAYANDRRQGRIGGNGAIINHPDVRRMLLTMRALTHAARAICYATGAAIDRAHRGKDDAARKAGDARASLLTPVAKAFSTDIGTEVASLGVQVHGGMGFIEETGAAQHYRDARIAQIYEGTNGIQAIDLVMRKLPMAGGAVVRGYLDELRRTVAAVKAANDPAFGATGARLSDAVESLDRATTWLLGKLGEVTRRGTRRRDAVSAAVRLCGGRLHAGRGGVGGGAPQRRRGCGRPRRAGAFLRREHRRAGGRTGNHRDRRRGLCFRCGAARRGLRKNYDRPGNRHRRRRRPDHPDEPAGEEERAHLRDVRRDGRSDRDRGRRIAHSLCADLRCAGRVLGRQ